MMKKDKILININNLSEVEEYKKIGINNFLFSIEGLSIGYNVFPLESVPTTSYLLINRVFDTEGIEYFKSKLDEIKKYKGVIFEDLGVYNLLKDSGVELIWFQNHYTTNYVSMNYYLTHNVKSAVISNEITGEEIKEILNKTVSPLVLNVFGKNQIMYSRRTLMSNFNKHNNLSDVKEAILNEPVSHNEFLIKENNYGTVIFNNEYFNYIEFSKSLDENKILYYLIMNQDFNVSEIESIINGKYIGNDGFLNRKTVYRLEDYK